MGCEMASREVLELHGPWWLHPDGQWVDKANLPCKDESVYVRHDGGCLRCDADAGVACRKRVAEVGRKAG